MIEKIKEHIKQQLQTCEFALNSNPDALQKEYWEGRQIANLLVEAVMAQETQQ